MAAQTSTPEGRKEYLREWRKKRPDLQKEYKKRQFDKYYKWLNAVKDVPCVDCGNKYPSCVMDLDHVPERGKKSFNFSTAYWRKRSELESELAKCDVVCANCHRIRTHILRKDI